MVEKKQSSFSNAGDFICFTNQRVQFMCTQNWFTKTMKLKPTECLFLEKAIRAPQV